MGGNHTREATGNAAAEVSGRFRAVLVALTGGQKLGLVLVAGVFIAFALVSAMVIPRRRPDFPGSRGVKAFVALSVILAAAMLAAIALLAQESEEGEAEGGEVATETRAAETETQAETRTGEGQTQAAGDAEAGAAVFGEQGCGGCHALEEAGSGGTIGPNLDESRPDFDLVVERVTNGKGVMPAFRDELSEADIQNVAAYVVAATGGS
jgi:cytochrome c6